MHKGDNETYEAVATLFKETYTAYGKAKMTQHGCEWAAALENVQNIIT